jgi:hypothetical protein
MSDMKTPDTSSAQYLAETSFAVHENDQRMAHACDEDGGGRYAIQAVHFNCTMVAATDGRILAVKRKESVGVDNKLISFGSPEQKKQKRNAPSCMTYFKMPNGDHLSPDGKNSAREIDARFPRYESVIPSHPGKFVVSLDAELLLRLAKAITPKDENYTVMLEIDGQKDAILVRSTHTESAIGVIMPLTIDKNDKTPFQVAKAISDPAPMVETVEPEPVIEQPSEENPENVYTTEPETPEPDYFASYNAALSTPVQAPVRKPRANTAGIDWESIARRQAEGATYSALASELGVSQACVFQNVKKIIGK